MEPMPETDTDTDLTAADTPTVPDREADQQQAPRTPFHDLDGYVALRRQGAIALSPDGSRLVAVASELNAKKTGYASALWEVDPAGEWPATRLTRSAPGEANPVVLPDNSVLFVSKRPDPAADKPDDDARPALWLLPAGAGEARQVATWDGGVTGVLVARESGDVLVTATAYLGTDSAEQDADKRKRRKDSKVAAILHDAYPVRYWDHDLGPEQPRLYAAGRLGSGAPGDDGAAGSGGDGGAGGDGVWGAGSLGSAPAGAEAPLGLRDLTPDAGRALFEASMDLSRDGSFAVTSWQRVDGHTDLAIGLVRIELASGERTEMTAPARAMLGMPAISPDGTQVAYVREDLGSATEPDRVSLWLMPAGGTDAAGNRAGGPRQLPLDGDLRPTSLAWSPDGSTLYFTADEVGRAPVFALDVKTGARRRLARDGAYSSLQVHPDGRTLFAVRASYTDPGTIVALDATATDQEPRELRGPAPRPALPGTLTELTATAEDGTPIRSYLALPEGSSPENRAPLLLWVHGGPVSSWNSWSWRWCPWLLVAQGYAVLLPDPALSTGYGQDMIRRGWGRWGAEPFTDVMAATDAALAERDDLDAGRTAMMGGSFGGYMANWIAGHTDRFRAIVSHASLWDLPAFGGTTDAPSFWRDEMSPAMARANSPAAAIGDIRTPMLVIHGDKDYRVPIGEGLRLWWDLLAAAKPDEPLPHRFLYFPDENHWVLTPEHAKVWYATVLAFLGWHVLGQEFQRPELL
jgi:dipeptidyl aminopeptidase/acylaminoacyl peptidase